MKHEEDGRLMAYVDGELRAEDARAVETHVEECPDCALATSRLRVQKASVGATLSQIDVDAAPAARRVRGRLRQLAEAGARGPTSHRDGELAASAPPAAARGTPLPREAAPTRPTTIGSPKRHWFLRARALQAALFVLFMAGGAAAVVPGSPLRRWLQQGNGEGASTPALMETSSEEVRAPEPASLSAVAAGGRLRIVLRLPAGTELRVVPVDGARATVSANPDTRFTSAEGVLEADVSGGVVRVELPRGVTDASLEVNGELYDRAQGGEVHFTAPAADSSDAEVSFRIREP
jgi:anti-sigma factor RsiW